MNLIKVLGTDGQAIHGGSGSWPLPEGDKPGAWLEIKGKLVVCQNALHGTPEHALLRWYRPDSRLFAMEPDLSAGVAMEDSTKAGFKRARLLYEINADWPLLKLCPQAWVYIAMRDAAKTGEKADLSGAYLNGADLSGANLSEANLTGAYLTRADLSGANLYGANLNGAYLNGAYLTRAYLSGADLSGANLYGADLNGANLSEANLTRANLSGANLYGANLSGADLSEANLNGAYRPAYVPDGWEADRSGYLKRVLQAAEVQP